MRSPRGSRTCERVEVRDDGVVVTITPTYSGCPAMTLLQLSACCPRCRSFDVREVSRFGSTACKALYACNACQEPFDYFRPR